MCLKNEKNMKRIVKQINIKALKNKPFIIGIDGSTGSGKTTLAKELEIELENQGFNIIALHLDDFIHKRNIRYNNEKEEWYCFYHIQWRYEYLIDEILNPIKQYCKLDKYIELYERDNDKYIKKHIFVNEKTIVILEGIFLQKNEIVSFFDYIVFLNVARNIRLERVMKRDRYIGNKKEIMDKYIRRYFPAEDYYLKNYSPKDTANIVL